MKSNLRNVAIIQGEMYSLNISISKQTDNPETCESGTKKQRFARTFWILTNPKSGLVTPGLEEKLGQNDTRRSISSSKRPVNEITGKLSVLMGAS